MSKSDRGATIRLWTIQPPSVVDTLLQRGRFVTKWSRLKDPDYARACRWMADQMVARRMMTRPRPPVWAWHSFCARHRRPDMRKLRHWERPTALITLEAPSEFVLLSDFIDWHDVLNECYLSKTESEFDAMTSLEKHGRLTREMIERSWVRIFDWRRPDSDPEWRGNADDAEIQACLPYLDREWIVSIEHFSNVRAYRPARVYPSLPQLRRRISKCERCPELRAYCAEVGRTKRKSFAEWEYWAGPVPGFGDPEAWLWIVGLAPAAHGANRTGRMFTGDRSGDFLYAGLHRAGLASQPEATSRDDGLELRGVFISAAARCAPPANRPTREQLGNCRHYLIDEWFALRRARVILALGGIAWDAVISASSDIGYAVPKPRPKFSHGGEVMLHDRTLIGCYHVSQQNTFTGRLTPAMFDDILRRAALRRSELPRSQASNVQSISTRSPGGAKVKRASPPSS